MKKIHLLSDETISRIAAGEVIERPASVVKELIENSIDAGSTRISIEIKQAGKTLIKIKDDGSGIEKEDMDYIFLRHATSKINIFEDLSRVHSLGFRGEALYSIASVSEVFLRSKTSSSEHGWEIHIRDGKKSQPKPVALQFGTEIEVHNLFFNLPVRKKFLKSDATELHRIIEVFIPYAILFYKKSFTLTHNKKDIFNLKSDTSITNRIKNIFNFNPEFIHEITYKAIDGSISLRLILGDINIKRTKRDAQFLFVNNRPVQCAGISFAVNNVYRSLMPPESYPFFSIFIDIPPQDIDVNIHPTKREIKIKNEYVIAEIIKQQCKEVLNKEIAPKQVFTKENSAQPEQKLSDTSENYQIIFPGTVASNPGIQDENRSKIFREKFYGSRFVGNIMGVYLVFDADDRIYIVDQHAAHERITFEKLLNQARDGKIKVQQMLVPITIPLTTQEMLIWQDGANLRLEEIGFQTTKWDEKTIAVYTSPVEINNIEIAIKNILSDTSINIINIEDILKKACRSSTMANEKLSEIEAETLKKSLLFCENPLTCPHGRPTIVEIEKRFIEKQFLR